MAFDELDISHHMSVARLREILAELPIDAQLWPNEVKNLAVVANDEFIGFISFLHSAPKFEGNKKDDE